MGYLLHVRRRRILIEFKLKYWCYASIASTDIKDGPVVIT